MAVRTIRADIPFMSYATLLDATIFGFTAWRVCLAAALLLSYVLFKFISSRTSVSRGNTRTGPSGGGTLSYSDAPTIRLTDTQRIDRLHRVLPLKAGEQIDLHDLTFGRLAKLHIVFKGIEHQSGQDFVHIKIDLGGPVAGCGSLVQELAENDFLVPRAAPDDQRYSVLHYVGKTDAVSFLQIKVRQINAVDQTAALDVLHVRGRWAGG